MSFIVFLIVGGIAGWLAGQLTKGKSFGLLGNIFVGIIGSFIGGFAFSLLGFGSGNFIGSILTATIGAVILLFIIRRMKL